METCESISTSSRLITFGDYLSLLLLMVLVNDWIEGYGSIFYIVPVFIVAPYTFSCNKPLLWMSSRWAFYSLSCKILSRSVWPYFWFCIWLSSYVCLCTDGLGDDSQSITIYFFYLFFKFLFALCFYAKCAGLNSTTSAPRKECMVGPIIMNEFCWPWVNLSSKNAKLCWLVGFQLIMASLYDIICVFVYDIVTLFI